MSLTNKTLKAGSWQLLSQIVQSGMQILVTAILARIVTPEAFGLVAIANIVIVFGEMFAEAGIGASLIQMKNPTNNHIRSAFVLTVALGFSFVILMWLLSPFIAKYFGAEKAVDVIRYCCLSVLITKLGMVSNSLLEREFRFDQIMLINTGSYILGYGTIGILLAYFGYGVWAIVIARLCQSTLKSVGLFLTKKHSIIPVFQKIYYKEIIRFGGGLTLSRIFNNLAQQGDYLVLGRFLGTTTLGIYERSSHIMQLPGQQIGNILDKASFPALSRVQDNNQKLIKAYLTGIGISTTFLIPLSILMIILAPEIILILLGKNWEMAVNPLRILLITLFLRTSVKVTDSLVRAKRAVYSSAKIKAIYAFAVLSGCVIGQNFGINGVAVAVNASVIINYVLMTYLALKIINISITEYLKVLFPGVIIGIVTLISGIMSLHLIRLLHFPLIVLLGTTILTGISVYFVVKMKPSIIGSDFWFLFNNVKNNLILSLNLKKI